MRTITPPLHGPASKGFSLIELMVGMVIALVISLVIFNVFIVAEGQRRTTAAGSDAQQAGTLSTYSLERYLRMGGSGMEQVSNLWGCKVQLATKTGTQRIPLVTSAMEAPFKDLGLTTLRAAPVLIVNASTTTGTGSGDAASPLPDALMVMGGVHRNLNTTMQLSTLGAATAAYVLNSVGLQTGDLLLAVEQDDQDARFVDSAGSECQVVQANSDIETDAAAVNFMQSKDNYGKTIKLDGGTYSPPNGLAPGARGYTSTTLLANLGTTPLLLLFAVGPSAAAPQDLRMYNMLDNTVQSIGDGVVNIQAVYGIADVANPTNEVKAWVAPVGAWSAATLMNGSVASKTNIELVRAIRLTMITRSALPEKNVIAASATWTAFGDDVNLTVTGTRTTADSKYRYRQFDQIIPVRNALL